MNNYKFIYININLILLLKEIIVSNVHDLKYNKNKIFNQALTICL